MTRFAIRQYEGFFSQDYNIPGGWARAFCAPLPDDSCGVIVIEHFKEPVQEWFDHGTEANLAIGTGSSLGQALRRIVGGDVEPFIPAALRRLNRLLVNGDMVEAFKDTLSERGLERAVAYNTQDKPDTGRLAWAARAGMRPEPRHQGIAYVLDLEED